MTDSHKHGYMHRDGEACVVVHRELHGPIHAAWRDQGLGRTAMRTVMA